MTSLRGVTDSGFFWEKLTTRKGECAFDVGANGGFLARHLCQNFTRVVAFEPAEESYGDLDADKPDNLTAVPLAVSAEPGELELAVCEVSIRSGQLTSATRLEWGQQIGVRTVPCTTVDDATSWYGTPDFVKIDTEGHEVEVLDGARRTLREAAPTLAVEVHDRDNFAKVIARVGDYDHIEVIRHNGYEKASSNWLDHFYVWAENWS